MRSVSLYRTTNFTSDQNRCSDWWSNDVIYNGITSTRGGSLKALTLLPPVERPATRTHVERPPSSTRAVLRLVYIACVAHGTTFNLVKSTSAITPPSARSEARKTSYTKRRLGTSKYEDLLPIVDISTLLLHLNTR